MNHFTTPDFWHCYDALPAHIRYLADKQFVLLKSDSGHPSLHLKRIQRFYSVRVGRHYRALGVTVPEGAVWFWIGTHAEYDRLIGG